MKSGSRDPDDFAIQPFKDLKKILKAAGKISSVKPGRSTQESSPACDEELFTESMKDVQEIREFRNLPVQNKKNSIHIKKNTSPDRETLKVLEEIISGRRPVNLPDTPEYVEWFNNDYREDITARLHRGEYSVQDSLDLHGNIVEEAETVVEEFIIKSIKNRYKCIKIIHGRGLRSSGGPVLKEAVVKWLLSKFRKYIIAFVTARQCDGGLGALYILLK
jgi:DNA-nicking Smr family endonuclease